MLPTVDHETFRILWSRYATLSFSYSSALRVEGSEIAYTVDDRHETFH